MIHVDLKCFHCGENLMDDGFLIDDHPSVKVTIEYKGQKGVLHMSSRYGSRNVDSELDIPVGETVQFLCPSCESDLGSSRKCYDCSAQMVTFNSTLGGYLRICSRKGCKKNIVEFENLETELRAFYEKYTFFPKGGAKNAKTGVKKS